WLRVELNPVPDWDSWGLLFGDFIHNLRSALDHLVYGVAVSQKAALSVDEKRSLQFPICNKGNSFDAQRYRIAPLSQAVRTAIESVQPYNRRHPTHPPLLALLRDFDDWDKHRIIKIAFCQKLNTKANIHHPSWHFVQTVGDFSGEIQNGADIFAFTIQPPTLDVNYDYEAAFSVSVSHDAGPTGIRMTEIRTLLDLLLKEVEAVIGVVTTKI